MQSGIDYENKSNKRKHLKYGRRNMVSVSVLILVQKWEGKIGRYSGKIVYMSPYIK